MHHLHQDTDSGPTAVAVANEDAALEAVGPATNVACLWDNLLFIFVVSNDFSQFVLNVFRFDGLSTNARQSFGGLLKLSLLDEETWGLGEEEQTSCEDNGPQKLDGNWDTVGSTVIAILGGVHNAIGEKDSDGDTELVSSHKCSTDLLGCDFGHVQNDDGGNEAHTEPSDQTSHNHNSKGSGSSLKDASNSEHKAARDDGRSPTEEVCNITSDNRTKEGTSG